MVDLVAEGLDLGLRISVPGQIAPGLVARPLKTIRYVLVATPSYLARHEAIHAPEQLLAHPFISLGYGQFQNEVELRPLHPVAAPATRLLVDTPITIASSLGPVLPGWALCGKYAPRVVHAVYAPTRHVPLKLRALIDYLVEVEGGAGSTA
jgi:DNA-binding transcriptional LysR family regulator